jgi:hypothetical protein
MKSFTEDRIQFPKRAHFRKNRIAGTLQKESRAETLYREGRRNETLHRRQYSPKKATLQKEQLKHFRKTGELKHYTERAEEMKHFTEDSTVPKRAHFRKKS